jgi:hypothetical protein
MKIVFMKVVLPDGYENYDVTSASLRRKTTTFDDYKRVPVQIIELPTDTEIDNHANTEFNKPHLDRFDCGAKWLKYIIENI